ncbi:hypothetical protein CBY_3355 [Clostridium butyricum 5521]|uniref:Uncharacterized protein n=1 Tax=Clostridium butyricum E4 str. BoNT E BL5262 TaxID=632245 RepID=C4IKC7_CLOBU|nr:hypothetical protein CBY_3355 [Clostridium butyricum 5521]EEP54753.1 hypothetical protein CLP_1367 [Clostridium butyricum E4 str. BoNT E BL5262]NFL30815.1 hypothetical protein [Clostridium butyricum]NFS18900.1 hypothetical protein [Clostridium butyricum]
MCNFDILTLLDISTGNLVATLNGNTLKLNIIVFGILITYCKILIVLFLLSYYKLSAARNNQFNKKFKILLNGVLL